MRQPYVRLIALFVILPLLLSEVVAQNCGQRDTIIFLPNSTASIDLEISDYFNDDLADPMQGLCAIELGFVHQFVENFELSLTSPDGQTVNLLGPNSDDALAFTPGTQWNITLINCATVAEPDSAFADQWDNEQTENWVPFGNYTGSYYPFDGCLEDFNTGPVNGTWTFDITNDPSNNPGAITYIRLIFCDSRGVECCFAVAGEWENDNIAACLGADTLLIEPDLFFPLGPADTTEYGYAFLIGESGIYQELDSLLDLRGAPPGEYEICGFSYRRSQLDSLPLPDGMLTLDSIRTNLEGLEPLLCAQLTPECLRVSIQAPPDTTRLNERICRGDSIVVGTQSFMDGGFYTVDLLSEVGCDSVVTLDLFVQEVQFTALDSIVCPGDTVFVGTMPYFETGIYQDTLPSVELGCDSIITLNLTVLAQQVTILDPVICAGGSFMVGDSTLTTPGQYQILLTSVAGCDSLVTVNLEVLDPMARITGDALINCAQPGQILSAASSTPFADLSFQWLDMSATELGTGDQFSASADGNYVLLASQELLGTTCTSRDTFLITANFATPTADPGSPPLLTCAEDTITIGGMSTSQGPAYIYEWTTAGGNIIGPNDGPFATVDLAAQYQLIVQDTFSFCRDTAMINVTADQVDPAVLIEPTFTLNCLVTADTLDGSASLQAGFVAQWTGPCIIEEPAPGLAIVDCPAWYFLEVTNTATGCSAIDSVLVDEDLLPATAIIDPADTLTCAQPEVILDGSASTPPGLLDFSWLGPNNETGTANTLAVTAGGEYELIVTRQDNFCQDTTTVTVFQDTLHPIADTGPGFNLTCTQDSVVLRGPNTSTGPDFSYNWFENGNLITDENTDSLLVTAAATYTIEVIDNSNGCSATDMVIITEDFVPPEDVEAGPNQLLSCGGDIVILSPDSTLFSRPVSWEWTADCIEPYSDTWALATDCSGRYTLTVTNLDNGCSGSDTTRVNVTPNFSQAVLPDTAFLSCVDGTAILDNTGSVGTLFNWFRDGLSITLPNNQPLVDAPGIYTLITSDLSLSCADTAQVNVVFDCAPLAIINTPDTLTCAQQSIILQSSDSQTVGPNNYRWEGPDPSCFVSPTDQPTAEVVCPGTYRLIIEHALFGEADTTETIVLIDTIAPQVDAGENVQLTCTNPTANLNGTVLNPGAPLTFAWTNFVPGDTLAETQAFSTQVAGTYRFFARNSNNGCVGSDIVQVTLNNTTPTIAFGSSVYPCEADSFLLEAFISPEAAYEYTWTGPAIQTLTDSAAVWITGPGMYTLSVLNTETGCDALDSILVIEQTCVPCLELPQMDTLDCQITSLELDATFCRPCVDCTLQWSDESGQIPGEESLSLNVTSPGIYILTATDTLGFTSSVSTTVILLDDPPMLDLGPDLILTCDSTTVTIANQIANTPDQPLGYQWSELVLGVLPETGPSLEVSEIGTYVLELTDMISGCSITDTLEVLDDRQDPTAEAGPEQVLTCQSSVVILDGSGSTLSGVSFAWAGPNDACLTGADSNSPLATCPGLYTLEVTNLSNGCSAQDIVRVTINEDVPEVQAFPDTTLTCNIQELLLSSTPPDGGNFTTSWCPLDEMGDEISVACALGQTDTLVNLPGQYRFTVVNDDTGCANSFVVTVGIDTIPPIINAGMNDTLGCNDNSIQLNAQVPANVTLNWTGPMGATILNPDTSTPTVDAVGWYFLAATSTANGCVAIDSVQILVDANTPILDAGVDTLLNCANTSIRLNASGDTFNGDPIWQWDTDTGIILADADQPTPLVGDAAFYFVTLTDSGNGCSIQDTVFVDADFRRPDALLVEPDSLLLTCAQDTLLLDASPSLSATGEAITYSWEATPPGNLFPDLSAPTVFTDRTGNYRLIVQDEGNGCRDTLAFFVDVDFQAPELVIANPAPLDCANMSTLLSTSTPADSTGFTFEWSDEQDQIISANATAEATSPGFYNLLLTDEANGCTSTTTVEVLINDELPSVIIAVPPALTCEQSSVILDGSMSSQGSNYTYQWSSLDGTLLGNGLAAIDSTSMPGSYVLVVTDTTTGCTNDESVVVSQEGQPILGLEVAAQGPPCVGGTFGSLSVDEVVGGTPPFNYALNNGIMGPFSFFDDLLPGSYELQVQDANGCSWTETIILSEALDLEVDLGPDLEVELGDSIQLKPLTNRPISSWQWTSDFFSTNAPFEPVVTPTETQFVLLTVFDDNNCTATDTIRIFVDTDRDVFIPTAFSPDGIGENERFTIYAGDEVVIIQSLRIFSRWGNMVFEQENFSPNDPNLGWDGTLWGEPLNAAVFVYYAEILFTDGKSELITGDVVLLR